MRPIATSILLLVACGSDIASTETKPPEPTLESSVADARGSASTDAAVVAPAAAAAKKDCSDMAGKWENQMGSKLEITSVSADGKIEGWYETATGAANKHPLVGWVQEKATSGTNIVTPVSFTVRWKGYGSITGWTGFCAMKKKPELHMMWNLSRSASDFEWDHVLTGKDVFHR
jgi:hypothetical protein